DLIGYIRRTARQKGVTLDVNSEENSMLGDRMKQWQDEWFEDGMQKGMQLGKIEGVQIGKAEGVQIGEAKAQADGLRMLRGLVAQQLEARFGALTADVQARVDAADTGQLQRWAVRVVTASSVDAVFDDD
ncbi:MAG: hypothetical protein AAF772_18245, partial [Acidobacteriota bacterium]